MVLMRNYKVSLVIEDSVALISEIFGIFYDAMTCQILAIENVIRVE